MPFIELHLAHNDRSILINTSAISALYDSPTGNGPMVTIDGEECYIVKESYEEVKNLIRSYHPTDLVYLPKQTP